MRVFKLSEVRSMIRRLMLARKRGLSWISMYSLVQLLEQICPNSIISNLKLQAIPSVSLCLSVFLWRCKIIIVASSNSEIYIVNSS